MEIENRIKSVFINSLELLDKTDAIKSEEDLDLSKLDEYGVEIDSFLVLEILLGLEEEFEIELKPEEFNTTWITDIEKLKELIESNGSEV